MGDLGNLGGVVRYLVRFIRTRLARQDEEDRLALFLLRNGGVDNCNVSCGRQL